MSKQIQVPDIGDFSDVEIIEVLVSEGDTVQKEDELITLETDKATMEIPSPHSGKVTKILVKAGDRVSKDSPILEMETSDATPEKETKEPKKVANQISAPVKQEKSDKSQISMGESYAGPAVRRAAREMGIQVSSVSGSGRKGRVTMQDLHKYVKNNLGTGNGTGLNIPAAPETDFASFGEIETKALSRIQKLSGPFLHRNWVTIPHVTQFDEADITELEKFRKSQKDLAMQQGVKLTPIVFIIKAIVAGLKQFPKFNSSLGANGSELIYKKYYNVGVAVDTPGGLVVPVLRNVEDKGLFELADELSKLSQRARDGKLSAADMQGGCFTISSLGGIGGTAFTPIINAPEVAILGVSKSQIKPIYNPLENDFKPRLMLPLSLSYDHRVIDGAEAVRFTSLLVDQLADIRRLLL